jgi:hypothetical protein
MKTRNLFAATAIVAMVAAGLACLAFGNVLTSVRETVTVRVVLDPNAQIYWVQPSGTTILTDPVTGDRYYERVRSTRPFIDEGLLLGNVGFALLSAVGIAAGVAAGRYLFIRAVRREVARQLTQLSRAA